MTWAKLDDQMPDHPKIVEAGPLASWLNICGICYCSRYLTDGFIPVGQVRRLADVDDPMGLAARLVALGLWEEAEGGYRVHDYLVYNPSAEAVKRERAKTAERQANFRSKNPGYNDRYVHRDNPVTNTDSNAYSNAVTIGVGNAVSAPSPSPSPSPSEVTDNSKESGNSKLVPAAHADSDEQSAQTRETVAKPATTVTPSRKRSTSEPLALDSEEMRLATLLRDRIRAHTPDARVPPTTDKLQPWAKVFDLMLRLDRRAPPDIEAVIQFATTDEFWRANILSPGNLRDKYDKLNIKRQQAQQAGKRETGGNSNGEHGTYGRRASAFSGAAAPKRFSPEYYAQATARKRG